MHIKIIGFKCHLDSHYEFDNNSLILLKGSSGAGKSTILQAIFWCLYKAVKGVYNNVNLIKKCSVMVQINQLTIYRQKNPELLKVTISEKENGNEYENDVAQEIINQAFGSKDLWKSCSYIEQRDRCSLLSGTAAERLTLLNQLSFDQDNPKDYINRIDIELKTINKTFIESQAEFTAEINVFSQQIATRQVKLTLSPDNILQINNQIIEYQTEIDKLYNDVLLHERNIGSYETLIGQIKSIENKLLNCKIEYNVSLYHSKIKENNEKIQQLKNLLNDTNHYNSLIQQKNSYISQRNSYLNELNNIHIVEPESFNGPNINGPNINVTNEMIWQTISQENQHQYNLNQTEQLNCPYSAEEINNLIRNYQEQINHHNLMVNHINTNNQLTIINGKLSNMSVKSLNELENERDATLTEINELKKGLELLQCPSCTKSLKYVNKQLILSEQDIVNPLQIKLQEDKLKTINEEISKSKVFLSLLGQKKQLESQLININVQDYQPINVAELQLLISKLNKIVIVPLPKYSSDILKNIMNYNISVINYNKNISLKQVLEKSINDLDIKINQIILPNIPNSIDLNNIKILEEEINKLNYEYQKYLQQTAEYNHISSTLESLKKQKEDIEKLLNYQASDNHKSKVQQLNLLKEKLLDGQYGNTMVAKQKELEIKRETVISLNSDLTTLQRLKQKAIDVECKQLQDTVDTINSAVGDILPLFFNEPITMSLQLYKTLKTKKETKPGLNILIKYKGSEYDNINQLSGGEGDRISLALVLALNSVSNSPIILLDECISSLDSTIKESCVDAMKGLNKTIVCVDHEGVEGFYDKTITVDI